jgi:hypothetical protein
VRFHRTLRSERSGLLAQQAGFCLPKDQIQNQGGLQGAMATHDDIVADINTVQMYKACGLPVAQAFEHAAIDAQDVRMSVS